MFEHVKNRRDVLRRLILAELIAKPGQGPLALRGPLGRGAWFARHAQVARAAGDGGQPTPAREVEEP